MNKKYNWSRGWLWNEHIKEGKSIRQIALEQGVHWVTIRSHLVKNEIPIQKHAPSNKQYPNLKPSPELSYILGVIDGDGSVSGYDYIQLGTKDYVFAKEFERALKAIGLRAKVIKDDHWNRDLKRQQRMWKSYAYSVVFAQWYNDLTQEQKEGIARQYPEKYLQGFFESEGTYIIRTDGNARVHFSNLDHELLLMIQRLLTLLGYESNIYERKLKTQLSRREVTVYSLELLGSNKEKHEFIRKLNPCIKNKPYDYSDPNGLRGRKSKVQEEVQSDDLSDRR